MRRHTTSRLWICSDVVCRAAGEIRFDAFALVFQKIRRHYGGLQRPGGIFYDIGSGMAKPVFAAALLHPFTRCVGVELLPSLHKAALELQQQWQATTAPAYVAAKGAAPPAVDLHCGDLLTFDWSGADVVLASSTCFSQQLMDEISAQAAALRPGTFFVSLTHPLTDEAGLWKLHESKRYAMSTFPATVHIHQKLR